MRTITHQGGAPLALGTTTTCPSCEGQGYRPGSAGLWGADRTCEACSGLGAVPLDRTGSAPPDHQVPPMSDDEAHDVIARYNRHQREAETIRANAEQLIKREEDAARRLLEYHGERLQEWARRQLRGNRRSVRTIRGVVGFRTVPGRLVCTDEAQLLEYARAHRPAALTTGVDLKRVALLREGLLWDPATGEQIPPPPGVEVTASRETFYVKPGLTSYPGAKPAGGNEE